MRKGDFTLDGMEMECRGDIAFFAHGHAQKFCLLPLS